MVYRLLKHWKRLANVRKSTCVAWQRSRFVMLAALMRNNLYVKRIVFQVRHIVAGPSCAFFSIRSYWITIQRAHKNELNEVRRIQLYIIMFIFEWHRQWVQHICRQTKRQKKNWNINYPKMGRNLCAHRPFACPIHVGPCALHADCIAAGTQFVLLWITTSWPHQRIPFIVHRTNTRAALCVRDFTEQSDFVNFRLRLVHANEFGEYFGRVNLSQCIQFKCTVSTIRCTTKNIVPCMCTRVYSCVCVRATQSNCFTSKNFYYLNGQFDRVELDECVCGVINACAHARVRSRRNGICVVGQSIVFKSERWCSSACIEFEEFCLSKNVNDLCEVDRPRSWFIEI